MVHRISDKDAQKSYSSSIVKHVRMFAISTFVYVVSSITNGSMPFLVLTSDDIPHMREVSPEASIKYDLKAEN